MEDICFLSSKIAKSLYENVKGLPIIDYHCHLVPQEIFEDKPFNNIGEMFLKYDHYKWRLMRGAGINESYITGDKPFYDKFLMYAKAIEFAAGNPLVHWTALELEKYFGIVLPLTSKTADEIWNKANEVIKQKQLSPRKLILSSSVEYIATTDDVSSTLEYHKKLQDEKNFDVKVAPSFRTDNLLLINRENYPEYIEELSANSGVKISGIDSLKQAIEKQMRLFIKQGCRFSDVGIAFFPSSVSSFEQADLTFKKAIKGEKASQSEFDGFLGYMYLYLSALYCENNIVMQLHLAVRRNVNSSLFDTVGADCGADCIGNVDVGSLAKMLDTMNSKNILPHTIIYTLNPNINAELASIIGAFQNVQLGAAWWFCDHLRGIADTIKTIGEIGHLGSFLGMLTDSRSFLSYARHDYFRRILCSCVADFVENEGYPFDSAQKLVKLISYENIKKIVG